MCQMGLQSPPARSAHFSTCAAPCSNGSLCTSSLCHPKKCRKGEAPSSHSRDGQSLQGEATSSHPHPWLALGPAGLGASSGGAAALGKSVKHLIRGDRLRQGSGSPEKLEAALRLSSASCHSCHSGSGPEAGAGPLMPQPVSSLPKVGDRGPKGTRGRDRCHFLGWTRPSSSCPCPGSVSPTKPSSLEQWF